MSAVSITKTDSPESCLREFLNKGRAESLFARLVTLLGGLSYRTAFHVTGDQGLAEEASQQVFLILARKADNLRDHPSLAAWVHRTARYEADKIMKQEIAHRKRLEEFTSGQLNEVQNSEVLSRETWQLLDESIDRLNPQDRALVLGRFFEGKKFREIAAETKRSEAACKVRLRRAMDEMAGWLKGRGCTLSVTAIASFLGAEWSQACPPALISSTAASVSGPPVYSPNSISNFLTTMKFSKTTALSLFVLVGGTIGLKLLENHLFPDSDSSDSRVGLSERRMGAGAIGINELPPGEFFGHYDLAVDRLEELYEKYPNLRPREVETVDGLSVAEHLDIFYKEERKRLRVPSDVSRQTEGLAPWDDELIEGFVSERRGLIDQILTISEYSEVKPESFAFLGVAPILLVDMIKNLRDENPDRVDRVMKAYLRLSKVSKYGSTGVFHRRVVASHLAKWASLGLDVSKNTQDLITTGEAQVIISSVRREFADKVTTMEQAKEEKEVWLSKEEDFSLFMDQLQCVIGPVHREGQLYADIESGGKAREEALHELQDDYARILSKGIDFLSSAVGFEALDEPVLTEEFDLTQFSFRRDWEIFVGDLADRSIIQARRDIVHREQSRRELMTWSAFQQAKQHGRQPESLAELVPRFLPVVPVNASTGERFIYDAEEDAIVFSSEE